MPKKPYRIRITNQVTSAVTYLTRRGDWVEYVSGNETRLPLSNLVGDAATELRFALEDARTGAEAAQALRLLLNLQYQQNPQLRPTIQVL